MDEIHAENPNSTLIGGGLHSKTLKILWQDADQDLWKSKIDSLAQDIEANCDEFPALMSKLFKTSATATDLGQLSCPFHMCSMILNQTG